MSRPFLSLVVLAAVLTAAVSTGAGPALGQDDDASSLDDVPHITMVGHARAERVPDLATLTLGVVQERPNASGAVATVTAALVGAAEAEGVVPADVSTQAVTLTQTYDEVHDSQGRSTGRTPRGFEAAETISIRVRDLAKAGPLAQSLVEKGANRFDGIAFSVEHPEPIIARLTGEAVADARKQASQAAINAGVKLGRLLKIEPPAQTPRPPVFAARLAAPGAGSIQPGAEDLDASVEATWAIDDR